MNEMRGRSGSIRAICSIVTHLDEAGLKKMRASEGVLPPFPLVESGNRQKYNPNPQEVAMFAYNPEDAVINMDTLLRQSTSAPLEPIWLFFIVAIGGLTLAALLLLLVGLCGQLLATQAAQLRQALRPARQTPRAARLTPRRLSH